MVSGGEERRDFHGPVAVVGAGVAGLACARALTEAGIAVTVFDKARGPGGRISTRRAGDFQFDHGAPYFTVRDAHFAELVKALHSEGVVERWDGRTVVLHRRRVECCVDSGERWVGVPGMNAVAKALAAECEVRFSTRVERCVRSDSGWWLVAADGADLGEWGSVVISAPPEQAAALLATAGSPLAASIVTVPMAPCWSLMLGWEIPVPADFDAAFVTDSPLAWIARNSAKPGRPAAESWVVHAGVEWSLKHLEDPADAVADRLMEEFQLLLPGAPEPTHVQAHRWRFALPVQASKDIYRADVDLGLFVCGDWCGGHGVEDAYRSGRAVARSILDSIGER